MAVTRLNGTTVVVDVPTSEIHDWDSFHDVFASTLGFADYYGHNNNAFLDLLGSPQAPDVAVDVPESGTLVLRLDEPGAVFRSRCPEQYDFLVEAAAWRSDEAAAWLSDPRRVDEPGVQGSAFVALAFSSRPQ